MSLHHSDGFDSHETGTPTLSLGDAGWTGQSSVSINGTNGRFGGKSLRIASAVAGFAAFGNAGSFPAFAMHVKLGAWGGAGTRTLLSTQAGVNLITVNQAGSIFVHDGGGTVRASAPTALLLDTYKWVEASWRNGSISVSIEGVPINTYTGGYTALGTTLFRLGGGSATNTPNTDIDDLLAWGTDGTYFNGYGLSPRRIQLLRPSADGDLSQWNPASGTNWEAVDAADWGGGVGVEATVTGLKDLYEFTDLAATPGVVDAVVLKTQVRNLGADPGSIQHVARNAADTESLGAATVAPFTLETQKTVFYRDPDVVVWTGPSVNAAQFGQQSVI